MISPPATPSFVRRVSIQNERIASIVASIEAANLTYGEMRIVGRAAAATLTMITDQDYGLSQDDWKSWWADEQGYVYERPTVTQEIATEFKPVVNSWIHLSCFGAGTPVVSFTELLPEGGGGGTGW